MQQKLENKIANATKWSTITEFIAKMIIPITNMVLARLLAPEAFGIVATVTIVISFVDMFTDSGFQKYLIQRDFKSEKELDQSTNVAFITNLTLSISLWIIIIIFSDSIAELVGSPGLGTIIAIAGISLPITSFSSIQIALFRRKLDYRTLFFIRLIGVSIPLIVTIPLALLGLGYWSVIIGTICFDLINAVYLTIKSDWKPNGFYKLEILTKMASFSVWSLAEAVSIWFTTYIGTFIVANSLSNYYLGLYNTTIITVNGILGIITTATTSVLFSSLSRLQNNEQEFEQLFLKFLRLISVFIFPLGIGIFMYKELVTEILLGSQWVEASFFVGLWGLMSSLSIILGQYSSEVYRAKGRPKLSLLVQISYLIILVPTLSISVKYGFDAIVYSFCFVKITHVLINWVVMYKYFNISPVRIIYNVFPPLISAFLMGGVAYLLHKLVDGVIWELVSVLLCIGVYFIILVQFRKIKEELRAIMNSLNISLTYSKFVPKIKK